MAKLRTALPKLSRRELATIRGVKEGASRRKWTRGSNPNSFTGTQVRDVFSFGSTCRALKINLLKKVREMHGEFNGTIEVLVEGCGMSTVGEELKSKAAEEGIQVNVVKTDVYSEEDYRDMVRAGLSMGDVSAEGYHQLCPEELQELGEGRFHLVISRSAGLTYTKLPKVYGLQNVWYVLKEHGEAHILTENVGFSVDNAQEDNYISGSTIRLREYGRFGDPTPEGRFLEETEDLYYQELEYLGEILRIKKGQDFEAVFPPEEEFTPNKTEVRTRDEIEAHKTIFDVMERPPIEMSEDDFEHLRIYAKQIETTYLGKSALMGRPIKGRKDFAEGLDLVLRGGRYFIVAVDEFKFVDGILWTERKATDQSEIRGLSE